MFDLTVTVTVLRQLVGASLGRSEAGSRIVKGQTSAAAAAAAAAGKGILCN